jgi:polygalacturonase
VAIFDMGGVVNVEVTLSVNPVDVFIRPLRSNITHAVNGKKITFTITEPGQYSVEWNNNANNPKNALLIFANKAEDFRAIENSSKTITYEIGVYELDAPIRVGAGETLYLKQGAVIRGAVVMDGNNSKIVGRGIIDGSHLKNWVNINYKATLPIEAYGKNNIEISGITIFDPNAWTVQLNNSSNVTIDNLKIISSRCNSDGISIQSSDNITITNSFFRTWDDGIVIKNYGNRDSHTITAKNNILWTDLAQSMEIGVETNKGKKANPKIYNIKFEDNVVLHALHKAPISIHNGDNAEISNVTFKNITIENYQSGNGDGWNYLIDITNLTGSSMGGAGSWTTVNDRGSIHDVIIENVKILSGKNPGARFSSHQGGSIYDVTVKDVYYDTDKLDFSGEVKDGNTTITFE